MGTAMNLGATIRDYYRLAKPGIIYGNLLTTVAAFLFASRWHLAIGTLLGTVFGMVFVIGSACVFNNVLDRGIDAKMARTKERQMVTGAVPVTHAVLYASFMLGFGTSLLYNTTNVLTAVVALFGWLTYVAVYTPAKRRTQWAAVIGSIPGAVPIVAGYTAVAGRLDLTALILFFILAFWQLPHFYAIAIRRADDYEAAGVPTLPARSGVRTARTHIIVAIVLYVAAAISLMVFGFTGYAYLGIVAAFGIAWLWFAVKGLRLEGDALAGWAKRVFLFSLVVLCTFCVALAGASVLP